MDTEALEEEVTEAAQMDTEVVVVVTEAAEEVDTEAVLGVDHHPGNNPKPQPKNIIMFGWAVSN